MLLLEQFNACKRYKAPMESGRWLSLFDEQSRLVKEVNPSMDAGNVPILLAEQSRVCKVANVPMSHGKAVSLLSEQFKVSKNWYCCNEGNDIKLWSRQSILVECSVASLPWSIGVNLQMRRTRCNQPVTLVCIEYLTQFLF